MYSEDKENEMKVVLEGYDSTFSSGSIGFGMN